MKRRAPTEGDVWITGERHRRIVGIVGGGLVYSVGSNKNRVCLVATFKRWARGAELVHQGDAT